MGPATLGLGRLLPWFPKALSVSMFSWFPLLLVLGVSEAKVPSVMRKEQYTTVGVGTTACLSWLASKMYCGNRVSIAGSLGWAWWHVHAIPVLGG